MCSCACVWMYALEEEERLEILVGEVSGGAVWRTWDGVWIADGGAEL